MVVSSPRPLAKEETALTKCHAHCTYSIINSIGRAASADDKKKLDTVSMNPFCG